MHKNLIKIIFLIPILLFTSCSNEPIVRNDRGSRMKFMPKNQFSGVRKKIALLTFFNEAPYGGEDLGITATEELRAEISRTGEFVVDANASSNYGQSKQVYSGGGLNLAQLTRRAKVDGVNFLVFGRVIDARVREKTDEIGIVRETKAYTEAKIEVKIYDVTSSREIYTEEIKGFADDKSYRFMQNDDETKMSFRQELLRYAVKVAARKAIPKMVEISAKFDWVGRVAKIIGNRIYINAGREAGLNVGDILKVITEGQEIFDPETGAMIGVSKGDVKGTVEVVDYFGTDGAICILHSGGQVLEGDFVQLY